MGQGVLLYSSSYDEDDNFVQTANGYTYTFADGTAETTAEAAIRRTTGLTVKRSTISSTGTSLALSSSTDFFGRPVNSTLGVKDGANNLGSVTVDYTYQNITGDRTSEYVSSYKNVVTPTTGSATNVEYTYTYDANGNIVSDSFGSTLKHSYVYDEAGQLVRVNDAVQNKTFCYTYDNGGNLIYKKRYAYTTGTLGSVLQTMATYAYGYSNWKDRLTSYNSVPLSYDAIGNLEYFDGRSFTWSAGRQLEKYEISLYGYSIDYKYNADGLRTQKYIDDDQTYTQTTYDYIWADGKLVSQADGTDVLYFLYDSNDSPIGFVLNDSETYLYIKNLQGDITGIADENGAIIVNYTYDEWGKLLSLTDNSLDGIIGELNPLRYRGYYYDTETGYYYLQSRYYNPSWGRFINADAIEYINGASLFSYCGNNPVMFVDYTGTYFNVTLLLKIVKTAYSMFWWRLLAKEGKYPPGFNIKNYTNHGQCVGWAKCRAQEVWGVNLPSVSGLNAKDWLTAKEDNVAKVYKDADINNLPSEAVAIFTNGPYGHVIFIERVERNSLGEATYFWTTESNKNSDNIFSGVDGKLYKHTAAELKNRCQGSYSGYYAKK